MRHFQINIHTNSPDAFEVMNDAATKIACELDWSNDNETIIETVEINDGDNPTFISIYHMEPE